MTAQFFRRSPRPDVPSGEQLAEEIRAAARDQDVTLSSLVRKIAPSMGSSGYIEQLRRTKCPRQITVDRVRAVIEGRPIPAQQSRTPPGGPRRGHLRPAERRVIDAEVLAEARCAADRRREAARLTTAHPIQFDHRERTREERLAEASDIVRFAITEWPDIAREVKAYADESDRTLADAWRSVITAGLQCLREAD